MYRDAYCSYCGTRINSTVYPKAREKCNNETCSNSPSVGVGLIPINEGILAIRRNITPGIGGLAFPGGYINFGEMWENGIAREVLKETGIIINPNKLKIADVVKNAYTGEILVFGLLTEPLHITVPVPFKCDHETQEALIIDRPVDMVFEHHKIMQDWYFQNIHHHIRQKFSECGGCRTPAQCYASGKCKNI